MRTKKASYYRRNPLSDQELIIGGLVTAAVVGIGGYFIYSYYQSQTPGAQLAAVNAATGQVSLPGGTGAPEASQLPASAFSTTPSTAS